MRNTIGNLWQQKLGFANVKSRIDNSQPESFLKKKSRNIDPVRYSLSQLAPISSSSQYPSLSTSAALNQPRDEKGYRVVWQALSNKHSVSGDVQETEQDKSILQQVPVTSRFMESRTGHMKQRKSFNPFSSKIESSVVNL